MLAHWFVLDTLLLASQANRDGMHANALALTRQCVEAISITELGVCGHPDAEAILLKWIHPASSGHGYERTSGRNTAQDFGANLGPPSNGHQTDWSQQFWAIVWERGDGTILD